jgi:hypothetical protein
VAEAQPAAPVVVALLASSAMEACQTVGWPHGGWVLEAQRRGLFVSRRPPDSSGPAADLGQGQERFDAASPLFADAQEE